MIVAAVAPDAGMLCPFDCPITHSLFGAPLFSLILSLALYLSFRRSIPFTTLYLLSLAGWLLHIGLDVAAVGGAPLFYPVARQTISLDLLYTADPLLALFFLVPLLVDRARPSRSVSAARGGLAVALIYLVVLFGARHRAVRLAEEAAVEAGIRLTGVAARPEPLAPLRWRVTITTPEISYESRIHPFIDRSPIFVPVEGEKNRVE